MNKAAKNILRKNKYVEILSYILQNNQFFNSSGTGEFGNDVSDIYRHSVNVSRMYANNYIGSLNDKTVLEIGTGYSRATMLNMIKEYGLKKVYCYDRFNCINKVDEEMLSQYKLEGYLNRLEYISGENQELTDNIGSDSIDYVVSNAVLEHVDDLNLLFTLLKPLLKASGQMFHKVDLRCHNRFKNHGELYFHTFSNKLWHIMGGNIGQPNRILMHEYHDIFNNLDLDCETNIVETFTSVDLSKAKGYLTDHDLSRYKASIVEFKLAKKCI